ncbi:LysE family translocator [Motiliproteus coralliicola]|uniref:LysE family translocator n=1 Tax=Motiliproteus coralliicola TaxID=2283196 RepID=A0A369WD94_9GAMM|nr:LysE family translocator [Motiliproteus coralliicola]RDE19722.1 LysE family translocator [Motiliproteus coralliicola]
MLDSSLLVFILTSLLIILSPGQDMVLVLSRSIARSSTAGLVTAAGISSGLLGHTLLVAAGLGALLQASELAFSLMKYLGAAYLIYLGFKAFRAPPLSLDSPVGQSDKLMSLFWQGALSNLANPKIAIFYFAYLPQFVSPTSDNAAFTLLALGTLFAVLTFVVKMPIGLLAGKLSGWIRSRPSVQIWLNRSSGGLLMALGLRLATDNPA